MTEGEVRALRAGDRIAAKAADGGVAAFTIAPQPMLRDAPSVANGMGAGYSFMTDRGPIEIWCRDGKCDAVFLVGRRRGRSSTPSRTGPP